MVAMLLSMMAGSGEMYCQFMYTKRMFQWEMDQETVSLEKLHIRAFILQLLSTLELNKCWWVVYFSRLTTSSVLLLQHDPGLGR